VRASPGLVRVSRRIENIRRSFFYFPRAADRHLVGNGNPIFVS
jgi:hypothetical protein